MENARITRTNRRERDNRMARWTALISGRTCTQYCWKGKWLSNEKESEKHFGWTSDGEGAETRGRVGIATESSEIDPKRSIGTKWKNVYELGRILIRTIEFEWESERLL